MGTRFEIWTVRILRTWLFSSAGPALLERERMWPSPAVTLEPLSFFARLTSCCQISQLRTARRLYFMTRPSQVVALSSSVMK